MNIFELKDLKCVPDIVLEYPESRKTSGIPLVIDNGSFQCRAGWSNQDEPALIFKNLIAKPRKDRSKKDLEPQNPVTLIGNDIVNVEALRFQLRTQFDRNVVTHYHIQEQIFDYIFTHMGIDSEGKINHPIILTECLANPNYCRQLMSELLFECYDVPAVSYGIDSMFSFLKNQVGNDGLIISCGFHTTHVIPVLNGNIIPEKSRRINFGGYHIINFLYRLLQLKYPVHVNAITISRAEELVHDHSYVSHNYMEELKNWSCLEYYEAHVKKIQLPYNQPITTPAMTAEQKLEKKKELSRRLADINARKRDEKLAQDEILLDKLISVQELFETDTKDFIYALQELDLANIGDLEKMISTVKHRIEKTKSKIMAALTGPVVVEEKVEKILQPPLNMNISDWVVETKKKRTAIHEKKQARKQRKQDLAKRRTVAAQERMRIISHLAKKEKGTDDFGIRDEDWDVYKAISREVGDSDSEIENERLIEYDEILKQHDPTYEEPQILSGNAAEYHQLHVGVEGLRAPEILFQPSMIGSSEAGLAEIINFVLKLFTSEEQLRLASSIFLTGGCSKYKGLQERLMREMQEILPFKSKYKITVAENPSLDAWYGAREFANLNNVKDFLITNNMYQEFGGDYLKEHSASNKYFASPGPIIIDEL